LKIIEFGLPTVGGTFKKLGEWESYGAQNYLREGSYKAFLPQSGYRRGGFSLPYIVGGRRGLLRTEGNGRG